MAISEVIAAGDVECVFQPIIDASNQSLLGYEALARGPADSELHAPQALFEAADRAGLTQQLDFLCVKAAVRRFSQLGLDGRMFLNLTPVGLVALGDGIDFLSELLQSEKLSANRIVLELTEQAILDDYETVRNAVQRIRDRGVAFAIDDLGAGYSNLRAWSELSPDFLKIDRYFVSSIDSDPLKMEFIRAIIDMARAARSLVIAEGVETRAEAVELREAGVAFLQGFYIAPPRPDPAPCLSDTMVQRVNIDIGPSEFARARDLVFDVAPVTSSMRVHDVAAIFHNQPDLQALPVVTEQRPVGVMRRNELLDVLSLPLRNELYGRKPIALLMDEAPLVVDSDLRLEQVSRLVTRDSQERLHEQFIITDNGRYLGMGRIIDLLKSITKEQVQTARYSNPLTSLPGNVPIYDHVNGLLRRQRKFVQCYVDIDNFKPFNDFYGYSKGDEALVAVSKVLVAHASPNTDFVGHVGGDDFVVVFQSLDWFERIDAIFKELEHVVKQLYAAEHLEQGGITTRDRNGVNRAFPFLTISVAAIECGDALQCSAEDLAYLTAPVKARAKMIAGNSLEVEQYTNIVQNQLSA